jgi:hypothetical protein
VDSLRAQGDAVGSQLAGAREAAAVLAKEKEELQERLEEAEVGVGVGVGVTPLVGVRVSPVVNVGVVGAGVPPVVSVGGCCGCGFGCKCLQYRAQHEKPVGESCCTSGWGAPLNSCLLGLGVRACVRVVKSDLGGGSAA